MGRGRAVSVSASSLLLSVADARGGRGGGDQEDRAGRQAGCGRGRSGCRPGMYQDRSVNLVFPRAVAVSGQRAAGRDPVLAPVPVGPPLAGSVPPKRPLTMRQGAVTSSAVLAGGLPVPAARGQVAGGAGQGSLRVSDIRSAMRRLAAGLPVLRIWSTGVRSPGRLPVPGRRGWQRWGKAMTMGGPAGALRCVRAYFRCGRGPRLCARMLAGLRHDGGWGR